MGQKVNPHGLRVGVIKDWDSRWYAREDKVGDLIVEDYNIRKYLKSTLYSAGIAKIEIERDNAKVKINIHCSRPGVIIGKGGQDIEKLRLSIEKKLGKKRGQWDAGDVATLAVTFQSLTRGEVALDDEFDRAAPTFDAEALDVPTEEPPAGEA